MSEPRAQPIASHYVGGHYVESSGAVIESRYPATQELIATVRSADSALIEQAVDAAQAGFVVWSAMSGTERGRVLRRAADIIRSRNHELSVLETLDFASETEATQKLYGLDDPATKDFGMQMLASRRLVERGVRFIQVQHGAGGAGVWDAHGGLKANHERNFKAVDKPVAGLLKDLKQRGLLEETIVIFASEFGRTPGTQGSDGRDHHIFGFSVWMAGGGLKGGIAHGSTDEIGFHAVENRHYVTDIHATILKQLGLDSRRLEVPGRKRLDIDHGQAIEEIIA